MLRNTRVLAVVLTAFTLFTTGCFWPHPLTEEEWFTLELMGPAAFYELYVAEEGSSTYFSRYEGLNPMPAPFGPQGNGTFRVAAREPYWAPPGDSLQRNPQIWGITPSRLVVASRGGGLLTEVRGIFDDFAFCEPSNQMWVNANGDLERVDAVSFTRRGVSLTNMEPVHLAGTRSCEFVVDSPSNARVAMISDSLATRPVINYASNSAYNNAVDIAIHPTGDYFCVGAPSQVTCATFAANSAVVSQFALSNVREVAFSQDGRFLGVLTATQLVVINFVTKQTFRTFAASNGSGLVFLPNLTHAAFVNTNGINLVDMRSAAPVNPIRVGVTPRDLAFAFPAGPN